MKIVILGGTFNPPHKGHLRILNSAGEAVNADLMLMIPTGQPPHKSSENVVSAEHRLNLCRISAADIGAKVSDIEIMRTGPSYTVLTLEELGERYPGARLYITVGADMLVTLDSWYRYSDIIRLAGIIGIYRSDTDAVKFADAAEKLRCDGAEVILLPLEPDNISSTEIRKSVSAGKDITELTGKAAAEYITEHSLYKNQ